ncbi:MAG: nucleotide sugar dehydrogenase [Thermoplasmata archaeon]|nr:nucleotide sugar dehydrogenase [Thermoplasmata archaeon]
MTNQDIIDRTAKICIIGLGYVGLPTAVHFCEQGFEVIGVDIDEKKVRELSQALQPTDDEDLRKQLRSVLDKGKLEITTDALAAVEAADIVLVIVPTPVTETKDPDLSYVVSASEAVSRSLKKGQLIILESTTFPGTTKDLVLPILESGGLKAGEDFGLAYCPERYNPGDKEHTIEQVTRIVGAINLEWANRAKALYQTIIKKDVVVVKDIETAEAAKVIENIQRDLNIALFNELAMIFQRMGLDTISVIEAASTKWNFMKLYPGPGVGGHCLPVDPYYLTHKAKELGYHPKLILAGRSINDSMPLYVVDLVIDGLNELGSPVNGSKIAILGVSYKANTGDLRESPAKKIIQTLLKMKAKISAHDPFVEDNDIETAFGITGHSMDETLKDADCVILHTLHDEFKDLKLSEIKGMMKPQSLLVDTRHLFSPNEAMDQGFVYRGIGRGGFTRDAK